MNNPDYKKNVLYLKALADITRLMIIDMLSCGELCACEILEKFNFSQPTLSHHMKLLCDCGLVHSRREGRWTYYALNQETFTRFKDFLSVITTEKADCICHRESIEAQTEV